MQAVIDGRKYLIAGPLNLVQGGVGLIGRLPIYLPDDNEPSGDRFWGFATILLDLEPVLAEVGIDELSAELAFSLRGKDGLGANGEAFFGEAAAFVDEAVVASVSLPNGSWQITATVKPGAMIAPAPSMLLWGGALLLSALAGWFLFNLLQKPQTLQVAARERWRPCRPANGGCRVLLPTFPVRSTSACCRRVARSRIRTSVRGSTTCSTSR